MPRTLKNLINASPSFTPWAAGESFLNHVEGSDAGEKMTDWNVDDWAFSADFPNNDDDPYDHGRAFDMDIDFTQGSQATHIKRTGAARIQCIPSGNSGTDAQITSNVLGASSGSTALVTMSAPFRSGQVVTGTADFTSGSIPPPGSGAQGVTFEIVVSSGTAAASSVSFTLSYQVDTGPYNATLVKQYTFDMNERARTVSDVAVVEWHENSSYTDLFSSAASFEIMSSPTDPTVTYWLRYKFDVGDSFTNVGAVAWTDPRDS